jgi:thiaminase (transcriptional activator TenA)
MRFLGQSLAANGIPSHDYSDWISTYSSAEFEPLAVRLAEVVERYLGKEDEGQSPYQYAMECELDFFEAAWRIE